jgi:hypothetical protein
MAHEDVGVPDFREVPKLCCDFVDRSRDQGFCRNGEEARPRTIPRESWSFAWLEARRIVPDPNHVYLTTGFEPGKIYEVIYTTTGAPVIGRVYWERAILYLSCGTAMRLTTRAPAISSTPTPSARRKAGVFYASSSI